MKKRRINKGQPLNELVKGSLNYTMERLRTAFRAQFRSEDAYWNWYIVEVFADHVIVMDDQLPPDEFYRVSYTAQGASYAFAARDAWEIVDRATSCAVSRSAGASWPGVVGGSRSSSPTSPARGSSCWRQRRVSRGGLRSVA